MFYMVFWNIEFKIMQISLKFRCMFIKGAKNLGVSYKPIVTFFKHVSYSKICIKNKISKTSLINRKKMYESIQKIKSERKFIY